MYLKTKEHRSPHPRNRYQAVKHLIVPHRRSSVVNSNSINPRNDSFTYDPAGRLTSHKITRENSSGLTEIIEAKAHLYNRAGQRIYDVDHQGRISAYRYDQAARLIEASYPQGIRKENTDFETIRSAGLTPPIPGREPEDFFEYLEDNRGEGASTAY